MRASLIPIIALAIALLLSGASAAPLRAPERGGSPPYTPVAAGPPAAADASLNAELGLSSYLDRRAQEIRQHVVDLAATVPEMPAEFAQAGALLREELRDFGVGRALLLMLAAIALGVALDLGFRRAVTTNRARVETVPASVSQRLHVLASRSMLELSGLGLFVLGSMGLLLSVDLPPLFRQVAISYVVALCILRAGLALNRILLPLPHETAVAAELRAVATTDRRARLWRLHIFMIIGWYALGVATVECARTLGLSIPARQLVAYSLGLGLLVLGLLLVWRAHARHDGDDTAVASPARPWVLSTYLVVLWLLWFASAVMLFWLLAMIGAVLGIIAFLKRAIAFIARNPDPALARASPNVIIVCTERALRALVIIGAAALLARRWDVSLADVAVATTPFTRVVHSAMIILAVGLVADLLWNIVKALIESRLGELNGPGANDFEEARRRSRLKTLLPITKKLAAVFIFVMAVMMMLSQAGVEIGPLIAGAGVIGLAVGFGAQTLVRDIFSGFFYLLDDAFRVGEYIQSGNYKGTVESFSIRSVRLRHHRGPLYTVPFGVLGAIQNMSRDWVVDVLTVNVTYDTDLDAVKKIIKTIGKQLGEDPELAPSILQPLKMQGVQEFGDFAIQIRMKFMARPGEQFTVRRRAFAMIKRAFDASGIKFASPTVQVSGGGGDAAAAAAAQHAIAASRNNAAE